MSFNIPPVCPCQNKRKSAHGHRHKQTGDLIAIARCTRYSRDMQQHDPKKKHGSQKHRRHRQHLLGRDADRSSHKGDAGKVSPEQTRRNPRRDQVRHKTCIQKMLHRKNDQCNSNQKSASIGQPPHDERHDSAKLDHQQKSLRRLRTTLRPARSTQRARSRVQDHADALQVLVRNEPVRTIRGKRPEAATPIAPIFPLAMLNAAATNPTQNQPRQQSSRRASTEVQAPVPLIPLA